MADSIKYQDPPLLAPSPVFEVIAGQEQGRLFTLRAESMSIGRHEDNDIVIPSEAISRHHAILQRNTEGQYLIVDNQSKNGIQVNGRATSEALLNPGDVVQIGNSVFRYSVPGATPVRSLSLAEAAQKLTPEISKKPFAGFSTARSSPGASNRKRIYLYGGVGLLLLFAYIMSNTPESAPAAKEEEKKDSAFSAVAANGQPVPSTGMQPGVAPTAAPGLEGSVPPEKLPGLQDPTMSEMEHEVDRYEWSNSPLKQSEWYFRRGQKEYLNKNYHRAIEFFQTALSIQRGHELANTYLRFSIYEVELEAKKNMEIAIRYAQALQYSRAIYHFNEVVALMAHRPNDPLVIRAEKDIETCRRRMAAGDIFP